ncbi:MAG: hypothetical protein AAGI10_04780 [Pseudomonadota bacterium]
MVTDATLEKYLAGELSDAEVAELEAAVEADAGLEARLMALDPVAEPVAEAFAALRPTPVSEVAAAPAEAVWRGAMVAAVASIALLVGLAGGWWVAQEPDAPKAWVVAVADYQVLYQPETVAVLEPGPGEVAAQLSRAGAAVGADLSVFENAEMGGAMLLRAQVLGLGDRPIVQMVYQLPGGTPLALCLTERGAGAEAQDAFAVSGLMASRWQTEDHDILLIGATSENEIAALAGAARQLTDQI